MPRVAVGGDARQAHGAELVADVVRFFEDGGAGAAGVGDALVDVGHFEADVDDAVAVLGVVGVFLGDLLMVLVDPRIKLEDSSAQGGH